jgi:lysozyme family protein
MRSAFESLKGGYEILLGRMELTRQSEVNAAARRLMNFVTQDRYKEVSDKLGIPQIFIATSFEREASSNFNLSPAQGDPWNRVSTHVPRGRGPFSSWAEAAIDAYTLDRLDRVGRDNWTWARFCYEGELFNGFGYRNRGVNTPYLWSGSNNYTSGKFVVDGGFNPGVVDKQLGIVPIARAMVAADSSLDLPDSPGTATAPGPAVGAGALDDGDGSGGFLDTELLQKSLNDLGFGPLDVDGLVGRKTRAAVAAFQQENGLDPDGITGPKTEAAIVAAVKSKTD